MNNENLSKEELARYSRHLALPEVGREGQEKLKKARILVVGVGGLGSPAAIYLAAAGVGTIGLVDFDKVDESNLQRQILYNGDDINKPKAEISKIKLKKINNNIEINIYNEKLTSKNALEIIKDYDVVVDGSDNFPTRYLVNDACVLLKKPNVYGSVFRFNGRASVLNYNNGPCYRCLFPSPPPKNLVQSCADAGVLGILPGVIGAVQATEALKIILSKGSILSGRLLVYNALNMTFMELSLKKNKNCRVCGKNPTITNLIDYEQFCGSNIQSNEITVKELKNIIENNEDFALIDVREEMEWNLCRIDGAKLIPFSQILKDNLSEINSIDKNKKIVLYCHVGDRSMFVLQLLERKGYRNALNLAGGIDAWAKYMDQEVY